MKSFARENVCLPRLLELVINEVKVAGKLLAAEWNRLGGIRGFEDKAEVDVEIEHLLRRSLLGLLDCDFWGEETGSALTDHQWCWVVDPNDGTGDFLKGIPGSALSIGLLRDGIPVLGVVYAPVTDGRGEDCIAWAEGSPSLLRNGQAVSVDLRHQELCHGSLVMVSAAAVSKPDLNAALCAPAGFHPMPSIAYRLARVAAGDGVCGVSLYPVSAHDVVAGHALLRASGGVLLDQDGCPVDYRSGLVGVAIQCFGGAPHACATLQPREWSSLLGSSGVASVS